MRLGVAGGDDLTIPTAMINPPEARCLPRDRQTATATSFQVIPDLGPANAIDGDPGTIWHTRYSPVRDSLPQSITVALGGSYRVAELVYQPRRDANGNGVITGYAIHGSTDGETFHRITDGDWAADRSRKLATVGASMSHLRLEVTAGYGDFASAAEIIVYGTPG